MDVQRSAPPAPIPSRKAIDLLEKILCDRCGNHVEGFIDTHFTSGVYVVGPDSYWSAFARPGEKIICDPCMWADPKYVEVYGCHAD